MHRVRCPESRFTEDFDTDTYRAAYTAALPHAVYVLHVFKKKSKVGAKTPGPDLDRIRARLKAAEAHHDRTYGAGGAS